ncbi:MAG TPA: hypothetical protein VLX92_32440, partial [Kofleriaceae bacterium]|nr:hypothetical protein [Kofleriaceae bacterium]
MAVLCVNTGSSSIKLATFDGERATARIAIDGVRDHIAALAGALASVAEPEVVVHRIVHGGDAHVAPAIVDAPLIASLEQLVPLAPLHLPLALAGIAAVFERWPAVPQVACFDTAFHARLPELARRLPLPGTLGVRRYGFHGLSYEYVSGVLAPLPPRCVLAHLGSGASLVALRDGAPIDTTMGLTPTGGIAMATRTGDLDPGVLIYLAREKRMTIDQLERAVEREGGLVAIAGTGDMKALLQRRDADARL